MLMNLINPDLDHMQHLLDIGKTVTNIVILRMRYSSDIIKKTRRATMNLWKKIRKNNMINSFYRLMRFWCPNQLSVFIYIEIAFALPRL